MGKSKFRIITASVILGLMLCVSILSGCSLVTTDYSQYYKAIVASAKTENGKTIEITKKQLLTAYNNYGYQYVSYYGKTIEEAIKTTLEQLVSNELLIDKVETHLKKQNGNDEVLTVKEKTYLWEKTYDSLLANMKETEEEKEDENEKDPLTKKTYDKTADLFYDTESGKYVINKRESVKTEIEKYNFWSEGNKDATTTEGKEDLYKMLGDFVVSNPEYSKSYSKYLSNLKKSEEGQKLSTANKDVFIREIERLYEVNYDSYMATRYEEIFKSTETNVSVQEILDLYKSYVLEDYTTYSLEQSANYNEDILSSAEGMYYNPQNAEFFYVTHILVKFDENQTKLLETYKDVLEGKGIGEYTELEAKNGIEDLYNGLKALVRTADEEGVYTENQKISKKSVSATDVLNEVNKALSSGDAYAKAEKFNELMFKYNEDDGAMNASYNYVIGVDYSTPTKDEDGNITKNYTAHSKMVEGFTDAAIKLHNHGEGKIGDHTTEFVRSEYGLHILMYGGAIENLYENYCPEINLDMQLSDAVIAKLDQTRINPCLDYTYFDMLYDSLVKDNFSGYQQKDVDYMKSKLTDYNFYYNAYKDLL